MWDNIDFELDGQEISVSFKKSFLRGIHDVRVCTGKPGDRILGERKVKLISATPPIHKWIKEAALMERLKLRVKTQRTFTRCP